MPSSKGEPDKPELREKVKEEVKALSKGGGPGSWSAWKAGELARRYEAKGGGYKDTGNNKNKAKPGVPEKKDASDQKKKKDEKESEEKEDKKEDSDKKEDDGNDGNKDENDEGKSGSGGGGSKAKGGSKKK